MVLRKCLILKELESKRYYSSSRSQDNKGDTDETIEKK